jgi:gamma-glutamylputrescine oxidase
VEPGSVSLWQQGPTARRVRTGVCIVGAGIAGLSAGIELTERGEDFLIVEARAAGAGASGRNAGYLMRGAAENYAKAARQWGRDTARALWKLTEDNLAALRRLAVDRLPGYAERPSCLAALGEGEEADLRLSAEMLREDEFEVELTEPGSRGAPDDALWRSGRVRLGLVNPGDAVCDPAELVAMLRGRVPGERLIEARTVGAVEDVGALVRVACPGLVVEAQRVLVCTNAWAGQLVPELAGVITPNRGQMLALRPAEARDADLAFAYYLNHGSEYVRSGPGGTVLFGGCRTYHAERERVASEQTSPWVQEHLERLARELICPRFEVVARWAGVMGFSPSGLPTVRAVEVGGVSRESGRVWFCGGFTGHGMSMGHLTGRAAARAVLGGEGFALGGRRF